MVVYAIGEFGNLFKIRLRLREISQGIGRSNGEAKVGFWAREGLRKQANRKKCQLNKKK
jgi:hypothetical protein